MAEVEVRVDQRAINAVFQVPGDDGVFKPEQRAYLEELGKRRPMVFLAFAPKAAGTFLRQAAIHAVDGDLVRIVHAQGGRDAQPYMPTFIAYQYGGICTGTAVAHVHMQALPSNRRFIETFGIKPVVMIRAIPDMLASYWDMLDTDETARRDGLNCLIPAEFPSLSKEQKADFLIDIVAPWYASYFATWFDFARDDPERVLVIRYKEFKDEPVATLKKVLDHSGVPRDEEECEDALDEAWKERDTLRFNRGEAGRGSKYFTADHIARLARMLSHYSSIAPYRKEILPS